MLTALWEAGILDWPFVASKTDSMGGHHGISGFCLPPSPPPKKYNKTGSPFQLGNLEPSYQICWCHWSIWETDFEGESVCPVFSPQTRPAKLRLLANPWFKLGRLVLWGIFSQIHNDHQRRHSFFVVDIGTEDLPEELWVCLEDSKSWHGNISMNLTLKLVSFGELSQISMERQGDPCSGWTYPKDSPGNMKLMVRWFLAKGQAVKPILGPFWSENPGVVGVMLLGDTHCNPQLWSVDKNLQLVVLLANVWLWWFGL